MQARTKFAFKILIGVPIFQRIQAICLEPLLGVVLLSLFILQSVHFKLDHSVLIKIFIWDLLRTYSKIREEFVGEHTVVVHQYFDQ